MPVNATTSAAASPPQPAGRPVPPQNVSQVSGQVSGQVTPQVAGAIQRAARSSGTSFEYLLATAKVESNFNPAVSARTTSATGLFQFVEQTWLGMMQQVGGALGFGNYSGAISLNANGRYEVADTRL